MSTVKGVNFVNFRTMSAYGNSLSFNVHGINTLK